MSETITQTVLALLPLMVLVACGLVIMVLDAFSDDSSESVDSSRESGLSFLTFWVFVVSAGAAVGLWLYGVPAVPAVVSNYIAVDKFGIFFDLIICLGGAFTALFAGGYLREHRLERGEFYVILIFTAFGAMVLARSNDLLTLFIGLETMSLGAYAMVAYKRTSARAAEGAVKYFLLGSFAAAILLFGSALLYGATGHTNIEAIRDAIAAGTADSTLLILGLVLVLVGLLFKVSAVPFHMWTPDAYEGAITPATTFMSVVVKAAAFAILLRVLWVGFGDEMLSNGATGWPPALAAVAALTMIVGNAAAVAQTSVKRMLAYSSIAHAGYILVGVVAIPMVPVEAVSSVLFYMLAYTVSNALAFGSLMVLGSYRREAVSYEDLAGVGRRHPLAALPFILGVLTLMGFPPTVGFFGKYYVFSAAVQAGGGMVWLAVLGVLTSVIAAYYYLRVLMFMFMKEPQAGAKLATPMRSGYVTMGLVAASYLVLRLGLGPGIGLEMAIEAAGGADAGLTMSDLLLDGAALIVLGLLATAVHTLAKPKAETAAQQPSAAE